MDDYRIPKSQYKNLIGGLNGGYGSYNYGRTLEDNAYAFGGVNFSLNSINGFDDEYESFNLLSRLYASYNQRTTSESNYISTPFTRKESTKHESMNFDLFGRYAFYLTPDAVYLYSSSSLRGRYDFSRRELDTNNVHVRSGFSKDRDLSGTLSAGLGYGKMRDASAVFSVVRIIEKLNEDGFLTRELSKEEILALVDIVTIKNVYDVSYDRPKKYLLDDILNNLLAMGVLKENRVSGYEVARIDEVFQENIFPRMVGWTVDAGFQISRSKSEQLSDQYRYSTLSFYRSDINNIVVNANYGKAFSLSLCWYTSVAFTIPVFEKLKKVDKEVNTTLSYQIGEKINNQFMVRYSNTNRYYEGTVMTESFYSGNSFGISNSAQYFIENNIYFYFGMSYNNETNIEEKNGYSNRRTSNGFGGNFGLNYRFY